MAQALNPAGSLSTESPTRWWHVLLLSAVLAGAAGVRLYGLVRYSLWYDEVCSLLVATGHPVAHRAIPVNQVLENRDHRYDDLEGARPWGQLIGAMGEECHPPLYFLLLRAWMTVLGEADWTVRLLGVLLSLAAVALVFDIGRLLHGPAVALWGAAVMALAGAQVELAREARPYAMLVPLVLACADALVRIERGGANRRRLLALGLWLAGLLLTHYYGLFAAAGLGLYGLLRLRPADRRPVLLAALAVGLVVLAIWAPMAWRQAGMMGRNNAWMHADGSSTLALTLRRFLLLPLRLIGSSYLAPSPWAMGVGLVYVLPPLLMWLWRRSDLLLWWLLMMAAVGPVLAMDLLTGSCQLDYVRYTLVAGPAIYLILAALAAHSRLRHWVGAALVLAAGAWVPYTVGPYQPPSRAYRDMAAYLDSTAGGRDVVIFAGVPGTLLASDIAYACIARYARGDWDFLLLDSRSPAAVPDRSGRRVWLLASGRRPSEAVPGWRWRRLRAWDAQTSLWSGSPVAAGSAERTHRDPP